MKNNIDEQRAIELYKKYGSLNRASLSLGCGPAKLKKILTEHSIEIKRPAPVRFNINSRFS